MKLVFDIETNGLIPQVDTIWCLVAQDIQTKEIFSYSDYDDDLPSLQEGIQKLEDADVLAGHNIVGYDLPVLKRLLGWVPAASQKIWDTLIMSQMNKYQRGHRHSLAGWGEYFKYPKGDYNDWTNYNQEMLTYCIRDVELNTQVYERVSKEALILIKQNPMYKLGIETEQEFSRINSEIAQKGWVFDMKGARKLKRHLTWRMEATEDELEPQLGIVCVMKGTKHVDKIVKKNGTYYKSVCDWYSIAPDQRASSGIVAGPYSRVEFNKVELGQMEEVKKFLYDIGWKPDDWNVKKINGKWVRQSPKLTETSLEPLGQVGKMIGDYYMMRHRRSIVEGWIDGIREYGDGRLHGNMFTIGTPTFRCRHNGIVNIPGVGTEDNPNPYGKELRSLLTCEKGWKVVGADSAGNQMRGLCHYIGDPDFTREVIDGDIHTKNKNILEAAIKRTIPRAAAKSFLYAYLFGAGMGKLGSVLTGTASAAVGKIADEAFRKAFPGLDALKKKLQSQYTSSQMKTGIGFISGIDGRRIIVSSDHQLLNYLLQTLEGTTCKAAIVWAEKKLKEEGIEAYPALHYHDEMAWVCREEDAERVLEISIESFKEAPKLFGVDCMDGDGSIGNNYADVH